MSLSVVTTTNQTGTQTVTIRPVSVTVGQAFTLELFGVSVSFTATVATAANVVAGLLAAIAASSDPEWDLVTSELNQAGDALLISYSATAGDLKIWRGDSPAVSQVTHVTPSAVEVGDVYTLTMNGKQIAVTATAATASNVVSLFVAAIGSSQLAEFREVTATSGAGVLILTANSPGVPFAITGTSSNGSTLGVAIVTTTPGAAAVSAVNMTQTFRIPLTAAGGFNIWLGGSVTSGLTVGASAATVQTALQGLASIGSGNATVVKTSDTNDDIYTVTFTGALAATTVAGMTIVLATTKPIIRTIQEGSSAGTPRNEIQTLTMGDFWDFDGALYGQGYTLTLDGQTTSTIDANATAATVTSALIDLSNIDNTGIAVTTAGNVMTIEFKNTEGNAPQSQLVASSFSYGSQSLTIPVVITPAAAASAAVNEAQTVALTGAPTGGTFTLTFGANTTGPIAWNASAATVQTALQGLASIGSGNATVTTAPGGGWLVTFTGALAGANQPALSGSGSGLTGGSAQSITITTPTASAGPNHWNDASNWIPAGVPVDFDRVRFEFGSSDCLYGLDQSAITLTEIEISSGYTGSIGLPRINSAGGYVEYRTRDLTVNCPSILIGNGSGAGSGKIQLNTLSTTCWMEIRNTGGSRESGVPALTWYGDNEASEIVLIQGDLGVAVWSDQSATLNKIEQYGGSLRLDHATLNALYAPGQNVTAHETTLGGKPLEL